MKLIEDLGMIYPTDTSKKTAHYAIYECPKCLKHVRKAMCRATKNKLCRSCSKTTHGHSKLHIYTIYCNMIDRCYGINPKQEHYREAGIKVCDKWLNDFNEFREWSDANGYVEGLSIDRKDNSNGYSPDNCRWVTQTTQSRNTRILQSNNKSGYRGVFFYETKRKYTAQITVKGKTVHLGSYTTALEAAVVYDKYVLSNNLEHSINGVIEGVLVNPLNT